MAIQSLPLSYYVNEIPTSQYQQYSPSLLAWLTALLQPLDDLTTCLQSFDADFDLDTATGVQLDLLGTIVGQSRTVPFQPSNSYSPTLDDNTYRILLKAKVARNQWDGTIDSLQGIWQTLFPGGSITIIDGQNMTATVVLSGIFTSPVIDLINNGYIVPRPAGVLFQYVFPILPILGVSDVNTALIAGFDEGHFI